MIFNCCFKKYNRTYIVWNCDLCDLNDIHDLNHAVNLINQVNQGSRQLIGFHIELIFRISDDQLLNNHNKSGRDFVIAPSGLQANQSHKITVQDNFLQ
jgi:hypothetical protein